VPDWETDLELALALADVADEITLGRFRADDLVVETKPDLTPVSEADRAVERALRERLSEVHPGDAIVGEEYGAAEGTAAGADGDGADGGGAGRRRWILDPIDGTKSYVRGVPVWATLLALEDDGELVLGVVSAPALGRRWWAVRGAGAWVRDLSPEPRRLRVSGVRALQDAQLCLGGLDGWREAGKLDALLALSERCWRTRGYGDFWQYMLLAEGAVEIALDPEVSLWDLAAPLVVVLEAGGRFTDMAGAVTADGGSGVATNGLLHDAVIGLVGG
jgi:histidinol-phosphatase